MAERRMFAKAIIDSDAFLSMPSSARLLYYDLGMRADDDGFVDKPKSIMRMITASEDDLKILIAKSFIIPFDNGVVVIKHWRINNYLRGDRYKETTYLELKKQLEIKDNRAYTTKKEDSISLGIPPGIPLVDADKNRIDKNSIDYIYMSFFDTFYTAYPKKQNKQKTIEWFKKNHLTQDEFNLIMSKLELFKQTKQWQKNNGEFIPMPITWLNQKRWLDEITQQDMSNTKKLPGWYQDYERQLKNGNDKQVEMTEEEKTELEELVKGLFK